jgi:hypothetical protein
VIEARSGTLPFLLDSIGGIDDLIDPDMFKLCWVVRRPLPEQVSDIGTWATVLVGMAWLSIITNSFIFAFTTEQARTVPFLHSLTLVRPQMMQVFPSFFVIADGAIGADRQHIFAPGMAQYVWAGVFFIEHLLFFFATAVCAIVPDLPDWSDRQQRHTPPLLSPPLPP